jgi:hypothetical protein
MANVDGDDISLVSPQVLHDKVLTSLGSRDMRYALHSYLLVSHEERGWSVTPVGLILYGKLQ